MIRTVVYFWIPLGPCATLGSGFCKDATTMRLADGSRIHPKLNILDFLSSQASNVWWKVSNYLCFRGGLVQAIGQGTTEAGVKSDQKKVPVVDQF